jgi:hypothetical protein
LGSNEVHLPHQKEQTVNQDNSKNVQEQHCKIISQIKTATINKNKHKYVTHYNEIQTS